MHSKATEVPVVVEVPGVLIRSAEYGSMTVETGRFSEPMDVAPLFVGLPDDRCQCAHWGYILKGAVTFTFADRQETYKTGEVYYAEPGHTPEWLEDSEYIEFSPTDELNKTMEVAMGNAAKMGIV